MIVKPMVRNNICLNAHPQGCKKGVEDQIEYTKKRITAEVKAGAKAPKNVLVLGCSNGYGLASRITAGPPLSAFPLKKPEAKQSTAHPAGTTTWPLTRLPKGKAFIP